jgi:ribose/xylose/arabinose/galactoside ABC-type transport system permease subunit
MLGRRDLLCVGLLIAMAAALVPGLDPVNQDRYLCDVIGQMASYWVLPSMGFLLALRCGVLDLSVWMAFSAGSVAAAWLLARGCPAGAALAAGIGVGAAMGAANALLVRRSRLPSGLVTLVTALGVFLLLRWLLPERTLVRPGDAWKAWHWLGLGGMDNDVSHPLFMTRMLLVIMFYGATMLTMLAASSRYVAPGPLLLSEEERGHWMERTFSAGTQRTLALIVGGALSAAGGVLLLMDNDRATVPTWPIGDLRIPAAALLAGGLLLKGPRRTLLAGMCLPPAFTLATAWRQTGWGLEYQGYSLQLLLLVAGAGLMVLAARAAERSPRRGGHWAAAWLAAGAVTVWCASTNFTSPAVLEALRWTGAGLMAASATIHTAAKFCPASVGGNP